MANKSNVNTNTWITRKFIDYLEELVQRERPFRLMLQAYLRWKQFFVDLIRINYEHQATNEMKSSSERRDSSNFIENENENEHSSTLHTIFMLWNEINHEDVVQMNVTNKPLNNELVELFSAHVLNRNFSCRLITSAKRQFHCSPCFKNTYVHYSSSTSFDNLISTFMQIEIDS